MPNNSAMIIENAESMQYFISHYFANLASNSHPLTFEQYKSLLDQFGLVKVDGAMYALNGKARKYALGGVYEGIVRYINDEDRRKAFDLGIATCIDEVKYMADQNYCNEAFMYELMQSIKNLKKKYVEN